jgi:hypothetical protein
MSYYPEIPGVRGPEVKHLLCPCMNASPQLSLSHWISVCGRVISRAQSAARPGVDTKCPECKRMERDHDHFDRLVPVTT